MTKRLKTLPDKLISGLIQTALMQDKGELVSRGARMLMWSMIVAIVGSIASGAVMVYMVVRNMIPYFLQGTMGTTTTSYINTTYLNSTSYMLNSTSITVPGNVGRVILSITGVLYAAIAVATVFGMAELALQWIGWSSLRVADSRYSIGRTGVALSIAGVVLGVASLAAILDVLQSLTSSLSSQAPGAVAPELPIIAGAGLLSFIGGALAIAGMVMVYIGLWRLASAYSSSMIKASIVLVVVMVLASLVLGVLYPLATFAISLLGIASTVLLIVGLHQVSVSARQGSAQAP